MSHENIKYLQFLKTLNCCHCGKPMDDPHHVIGIGLGAVAMTASDIHAVPLCREHHDWIHRLIGRGGEDKRSAIEMQFRWLLLTQDQAQEAGEL